MSTHSIAELEASLVYHQAEVKRLVPLIKKRKLEQELVHPTATLTINGVSVTLRLVEQKRGKWDKYNQRRDLVTILRPIVPGKALFHYGNKPENTIRIDACGFGLGNETTTAWTSYTSKEWTLRFCNWRLDLAPAQWNENRSCVLSEVTELRYLGDESDDENDESDENGDSSSDDDDEEEEEEVENEDVVKD